MQYKAYHSPGIGFITLQTIADAIGDKIPKQHANVGAGVCMVQEIPVRLEARYHGPGAFRWGSDLNLVPD